MERPPPLSGRCDQLTVNKNALRPFSPRPLRLATGLNSLELILEKIFVPPQPRGTARVPDLDMVRYNARLNPTRPLGLATAPISRTISNVYTRSFVSLRWTDSQGLRFSVRGATGGLLDIHAHSAHCAHVRGGMRRSKGDSLRMHVTCFVRYLSRAASMPSGVGKCKVCH